MNASSIITDEVDNHERSRHSNPNTRSLSRIAGGSESELPSSEDEPTSSSGSSSSSSEGESESESNNEDQEERNIDPPIPTSSIPHIPSRPKPRIHRVDRDSTLLSRLSSFLPKMKDANEDLQREIAAGRARDITLDSVDDEGQYIEMNLGLGVLEEKQNENGASSIGDEDAESEADDPSDPFPDSGRAHKDSDVLGKLMGSKQNVDKPTIEEIAQ